MNFDILEEIEEITTNTNYIIEIYKNTSIICSGNMKYKINKSAKNIIDEKKYVIEGPGVKVQVDADNMDVLEYKQIDGRSYLCIPVDVGLEKDDIALK